MKYERYMFPKTGRFVRNTEKFNSALSNLRNELQEGNTSNVEKYIKAMKQAVNSSKLKGEELASEVVDIEQFPLKYVQWSFVLNDIRFVPANDDPDNEQWYWVKLSDSETAQKVLKLIKEMRMNIQDVMNGRDKLIESYKKRLEWDTDYYIEMPIYSKLATGEPKQYFENLPTNAQYNQIAKLLFEEGALNQEVTGMFLKNRVEHADLSGLAKSNNKMQMFIYTFAIHYCGNQGANFKKDCLASIGCNKNSPEWSEEFRLKLSSILRG